MELKANELKSGLSLREYEKIHEWLRYNYPKSNICTHCKTISAKRYEWALIKGKRHKKDISHYIELCTSCHRKYDIELTHLKKLWESKGFKGCCHSNETKEKISQANKGKIRSESTKQKRSFSMKGVNGKEVVDRETGKKWKSATDCAKELGINRCTLLWRMKKGTINIQYTSH